ncbi:MAG: hypothetical protein QOJ03_1894 [Frankiaceae bacterium]|nr:hypothetical protein [Frankiaceae bacterium]
MADAELKAGTRLRSQVSEVEVVVVRPSSAPLVLACGGEPMVSLEGAPASVPAGSTDGEPTLLGKRYVDEETGLELLCTKGGAGSLDVDGRALTVKGAKPLPSSD